MSEDNILEVTLKILAQKGYAGLTVSEVVARAKVSKATIYRRWPTKEELVIAAFDRLPEVHIVARGNLLDELLDLVAHYEAILDQTPFAGVLAGLISEAGHNWALAKRLEANLQRRGRLVETLITRAIERGELPPDTDARLAIEIIMGPLIARVFFGMSSFRAQDFRHIFSVILAGLKHRERVTSAVGAPC